MNTLKKYFNALKNNTDDIRRKSLIAVGTTVAAVLAGVVLSKMSEDRVEVILIEERHPEESEELEELEES